jgi:hypothetical protein
MNDLLPDIEGITNLQATPDMKSHLPVLNYLIDACNVRSVLEFGMGEYSTRLFIERCEYVVSVEMNSQEWFDRFSPLKSDAFLPLFYPGRKEAIIEASDIGRRFDMVFCDGNGWSRPEQVMIGMCLSDIVVAHDTQSQEASPEAAYGWERLRVPDGWGVTHHGYVPRTSVYRK